MVKFDLQSGYHHIGIFPPHQTYLGFSWVYGSQQIYYQFKVLPFGLASACNIFTKFLRPLVRKWRSDGIKVILYLDDGVVVGKNEASLISQVHLVRGDLYNCGLKVNESKSLWDPVQSLEWLGVVINLSSMSFEVPLKKLVGLRNQVSEADNSLCTTPRLLAKLVGSIISLQVAIGSKTIFFTRYMQIRISESERWDQLLSFGDEAKEELKFWSRFFEPDYIGNQIFSPLPPQSALSLFTDASGSGGVGFLAEVPNSQTHFEWDSNDCVASSTYRELKACLLTLKSIIHLCNGYPE